LKKCIIKILKKLSTEIYEVVEFSILMLSAL